MREPVLHLSSPRRPCYAREGSDQAGLPGSHTPRGRLKWLKGERVCSCSHMGKWKCLIEWWKEKRLLFIQKILRTYCVPTLLRHELTGQKSCLLGVAMLVGSLLLPTYYQNYEGGMGESERKIQQFGASTADHRKEDCRGWGWGAGMRREKEVQRPGKCARWSHVGPPPGKSDPPY